ncbi:MAG: 3-deoxy-7-phosphoheptulonate synthase, partial [Candidatus Brocadiaceae bacterium]|nr:3-deoxy-7-phosphoheptulonate synthase [Candidatus Brocadiaceae bacterium]
QIHRQAVSGLDVPTGIKNSTDGSIKNAIDAVIAVAGRHTMLAVNDEGVLIQKETNGNDYGHVILRGGTSGPNFESNHIEEVGILCEKSVVDSAVIVDCSHQNSRKIHTNQIEVARTLIRDRVSGKSEHLRGIMLESNIHEGAQKMPTHMEDLQYGVSVTDACLGWEQSLSLINELTDML